MAYGYGYSRNSRDTRKKIYLWVGAGIVVIVAVIWFVVGFVTDSWFQNWRDFVNGVWKSWFFPNGWNLFLAAPAFHVIVILGIAVAVGSFVIRKADKLFNRKTIIILVVTALALAGVIAHGAWMADYDGANYYASTTKFVIEDTKKVPETLANLTDSNEAIVSMEQGNLPADWEPRAASATGAELIMRRTGDAISNTELMSKTLTYLNGTHTWTAIRNGKGQQSIYGVASWDGSSDVVTTCEFKGSYALNKAFGGTWGKNLTNSIAAAYPQFIYDEQDMWGYCDNDKPVIVIPVVRTTGYDVRTVDQAAGVVTVTGSPSGAPVMSMTSNVKPGDFPGPVYPQRLVDQQLASANWGAGRHREMFNNFGFQTSNVASQAGNDGNYLLKSKADNRLYWVTPLRPRSTDSQTIVAYSVVPADTITDGKLNDQKIYVLGNNDPRAVNLDNLNAKVNSAISDVDPGFFTSGNTPGKVVEFLPIGDKEWQAFGEVNGRVKYRVDITLGAHIVTKAVAIDTTSTDAAGKETPSSTAPSTSTGTSCDNPSSLTTAQLATCMANLANELQKRQTPSK